MNNTIKILFVDDDDRYALPLIDSAELNHNLQLDYYEDWEEGFSALESNFEDYHAVIIDGKGKKTKDGPGDDASHWTKAIKDLNRLIERKGHIPYVILSKYMEIKESLDDPFFEKGKEEDSMFKFLFEEIKNSDIKRIEVKYSEVFSAFDPGKLPAEAKKNLLEVLIAYENNTWSSNSFTPLRKVIEAIYVSLHEKDDNLIPYGCLRYDNGQVNFEYCALRLRGVTIRDRHGNRLFNEITCVIPEHISWLLKPITKVCSIASHYSQSDLLTKYTLGTIMFGVIDLLIWYSLYVDKKVILQSQ